MFPDELQHEQFVEVCIQEGANNGIQFPIVVVSAAGDIDNHCDSYFNSTAQGQFERVRGNRIGYFFNLSGHACVRGPTQFYKKLHARHVLRRLPSSGQSAKSILLFRFSPERISRPQWQGHGSCRFA